jgi:hypothetical protein
MEHLVPSALLDDLDGLNPSRALILQAYYALRRLNPPTHIGVPQIASWIKLYEPAEPLPSDSLIQLTLGRAKVAHRSPGRPRREARAAVASPPLLSANRPQPYDRGRR